MKKHLILFAIVLFMLSLMPVSAEETKDICKTGDNLVDCIKSQYTSQGSNGLYHHDGSFKATEDVVRKKNNLWGLEEELLASAGDILDANDDSYRYAGGNYKVAELYKSEYKNVSDIFRSNGFYMYYLRYDSSQTVYGSYYSALQKAISDGYIETNINNWVCFGTDETTCDDEHLYRIIGIFDSAIIDSDGNPTGETERRIKLIKAYEGTESSLGKAPDETKSRESFYYLGKQSRIPQYYWSGGRSYLTRNWSRSLFNKNVLNGTYLTTLGEKWSNKIATTQWKIGGNKSEKIYEVIPTLTYQNEIIAPANNASYNAKVGLMYVSDYGFAASPENWTTVLVLYENDTNRNNNWLFLGVYESMLPLNTDTAQAYIFAINFEGHVVWSFENYSDSVRPTFYLNSDIAYVSGEGTETNPIRIASLDELPKEDPKPEKPDDKDNTETKPDESKPKDEFENPATGFFVPLVLLTIGLVVGIVIIIKTIKNKKIFKL